MKTLRQFQFLFQDRDHRVNADRDPYLGLHRVGRVAEEGFHSQVSLDPPEEEFHLPPRFVELADGLCRHIHVVGEEDQGTLAFLVVETDAPQSLQVILARVVTTKDSDVIAANALLAGDALRAMPDETRLFLARMTK